jgi:hypothetical protein
VGWKHQEQTVAMASRQALQDRQSLEPVAVDQVQQLQVTLAVLAELAEVVTVVTTV